MQKPKKKSKNIILFVDNNSLFERAKEKIKLLRSSDEVLSSKIVEAKEILDNNNINMVILCCENNDLKTFLLLKEIREEKKYDNINILILEHGCNNDFLIEMSDMKTDDIIHYQVSDWEFLSKIIKSLNKSALNKPVSLKDEILFEIGVINPENGFFKKEYLNSVLSKEISYALKNNIQSSIMAIASKNIAEDEKRIFELELKKSLRVDDIIIEADGYYYIFLFYTKLSQAYYLFEKLKKIFEPKYNIGVCISDINEKQEQPVEEVLKEGIQKTLQPQGSLIRVLNSNQANIDDISTMPEVEIQSDKDDRDYEIFHQSYKKKCKLVIEPTFKRLKSIIDSENIQNIFIDYSIGLKQSKFEIISNKSEFYLTINYNGITKISINTVHILDNKMLDIEPVEFEIMEFSSKKLANYIEQVIREVQL